MLTYSEEVISKITDIELECNAILHSFESTLKQHGPNSYKPFSVYFKNPDKKSFVVISRSVEDEQDYYTAISEMMFSFSAFESQSMLLAIDTYKNVDGQQNDVLEIYMACQDFCNIYSYPYSLDENNNFSWLDGKFSVYQVDSMKRQTPEDLSDVASTIQIMEALFLHVFLDKPIFDQYKLKSFFDHNNFEYIDLINDESESNSVHL
jgi:hypothetical protein